MSRTLPQLFCLGTNHKIASLDFREMLYMKPEDLERILPELTHKHHLQELMVLSTCNRLELYGVTDGERNEDEELVQTFVDLQRLSKPEKFRPAIETEIRERSYVYRNNEAVKHVFSVVSGLDSLVLGETQITGQFKDATSHARKLATFGPILSRLTQEALSASKKVRTQTDIGKKPVSISHAAIDLANRVYGEVSDHKLLIIGAGEMASVAAKYALKYNPKELYIVNRSLGRAEELVRELGHGQAYPLDNLRDLLGEVDIVLSSTSAQDYVVTAGDIRQAQIKRQYRPLFLIDIALPRDIDPACSKLEDVYLFDIDDLKQVVGENFEERRQAAEKAIHLIHDDATTFMRWMGTYNLKPTLKGFRDYLGDLMNREAERTFTKSIFQNLSAEQRAGLQAMLDSIAGKLSSDVGSNIHNPPAGILQEELAESLKILFPLPEKKDSESP